MTHPLPVFEFEKVNTVERKKDGTQTLANQ
jgi:hypothetical protein